MVRRSVLRDGAAGGVNIFRFDQQAHAAGQISLNRSGSGRDPVRNLIRQKNLPEGKSLIIVREKELVSHPDIPIHPSISINAPILVRSCPASASS